MACSRSRAVLAIVAVTVVALASSASAQLVTPLGILDLTANSGINPATTNPWQAGDTYRFAFTSSALTPATSSDINYYNTFVQNLANASALKIGAAQGVTWKAIASTPTVDARDNTSTHVAVNGTGESIFLLNGTSIVATDYIDLWSDGTHNTAINKTESLTTPSKAGTSWGDVWTGTQRWGYDTTGRGATYGTADTAGAGPLGDPDGDAERGLWPYTSGTHWIWRWGGATTYELPIYGLSDPLTVTGPGGGPGPVDIPIVNGSFELPPRGDGGYGPATGWDEWGPVQEVGNWYPEGDQYTSGAPDGNHVGYVWQESATGSVNGLTQVLGTNFEPSTDYSLSVEIGNCWDYYFSGYAVQLLAGGVVIAEDNNTLHPPWEEWATSLVNYTYDPADAGLVGLPLEIRLLSLGTDPEGGGADVEVEFDHVRLTALRADVIPEPATLSLLGLGALLALRRRRRQP